ncbi:MAG TPA: hypothetical protein VF754_07480 [Pyrinomonadaceae bacterium]
MRKILCAIVAALSLTALSSATHAQSDKDILSFRDMAGVSGPYRGPTNAIRGIPGGGANWLIDEGRGELRRDGRLRIRVRGLVLESTGANPSATFKGAVSCQTIDAAGAAAVTNVFTEEFPATPTGDADIDAVVTLPSRCFAPIIFVTNAAGRWFAVTGY